MPHQEDMKGTPFAWPKGAPSSRKYNATALEAASVRCATSRLHLRAARERYAWAWSESDVRRCGLQGRLRSVRQKNRQTRVPDDIVWLEPVIRLVFSRDRLARVMRLSSASSCSLVPKGHVELVVSGFAYERGPLLF